MTASRPRPVLVPGVPDYLDPAVPAGLPRVPMRVVDATDELLAGFGHLVDDPARCKVEIVRWPAAGWRPVDLDSGDEGGTVHLEDGWIVIDGMDRRFERVALSLSSLTEHRLRIGNRAWALWPLAAGRTPVTMAVERAALGPVTAWRLAHAGGLRRAAAAAGPEPTMDGGEGGGS